MAQPGPQFLTTPSPHSACTPKGGASPFPQRPRFLRHLCGWFRPLHFRCFDEEPGGPRTRGPTLGASPRGSSVWNASGQRELHPSTLHRPEAGLLVGHTSWRSLEGDAASMSGRRLGHCTPAARPGLGGKPRAQPLAPACFPLRKATQGVTPHPGLRCSPHRVGAGLAPGKGCPLDGGLQRALGPLHPDLGRAQPLPPRGLCTPQALPVLRNLRGDPCAWGPFPRLLRRQAEGPGRGRAAKGEVPVGRGSRPQLPLPSATAPNCATCLLSRRVSYGRRCCERAVYFKIIRPFY